MVIRQGEVYWVDLGEPIGILDADALVWPTRRSYTGSPTVELHTYGSLPILEAIVSAAVAAGARPAGPGEFTMRAFLAGRIDLTQAEAVLGVIDASTRTQLDVALSQLAGNVARPLGQARERLLDLLADLEAGLDFVDEDISFIDDRSLRRGLDEVAAILDQTRRKMAGGHRSAAVETVVLRGFPNVGKSSLLNALLGHGVAIVSEHSGTTRDAVWRETSIGPYRVQLTDTAGIDPSCDPVLSEGQRMAETLQSSAALTLLCVAHGDDGNASSLWNHWLAEPASRALRVATKADQLTSDQIQELTEAGWIITSAETGEGLERLRSAIVDQLHSQEASEESGVWATASRCRDSIVRAVEAIDQAIAWVETSMGHEYIAAEMRLALTAISEMTGEVYADDILDRVFSRFCIGK